VLLLTIIAVMTIAGPWLAPFDPQQFNPLARLQGPSAQYWLGTDQFRPRHPLAHPERRALDHPVRA